MGNYKYNPFTDNLDSRLTTEDIGNITVINEIPTPATDGAQTVFTVASSYVAGSLQVFLDGLGQVPAVDFAETTGTTFTMVLSPEADETLWVNYVKA